MSENIKVVSPSKKSEIEAIRKKTTGVERALHSLETSWKTPNKMKDINKWQKAIEEKINYSIKTLSEVNNVVKNNVDNIKEIKDVLRHNYENIKTIFDILENSLKKDKTDKGLIYKTLKKKLPF
jgi:predicted DNA-binding ArsR family transcriptional regulator